MTTRRAAMLTGAAAVGALLTGCVAEDAGYRTVARAAKFVAHSVGA
ncbi:hypothetical protein [Spelaeicoccus albus]|uniref:Uncharacterized protein n=1 Tax=Spelaeicoccus albus TaxID=1280376 RepID=A0A7Z0D1J5_9MICO|nr:hypothetical protein [Spelaeicoccus albus]NYI67133.1 hypothetical protein [Spelaeicoccus albus]